MKNVNLSETIQKIHSPLIDLGKQARTLNLNRVEFNNDIFNYPLIVHLLNQYKHELALSFNSELECPIAVIR